jgi:hypothetical protein
MLWPHTGLHLSLTPIFTHSSLLPKCNHLCTCCTSHQVDLSPWICKVTTSFLCSHWSQVGGSLTQWSRKAFAAWSYQNTGTSALPSWKVWLQDLSQDHLPAWHQRKRKSGEPPLQCLFAVGSQISCLGLYSCRVQFVTCEACLPFCFCLKPHWGEFSPSLPFYLALHVIRSIVSFTNIKLRMSGFHLAANCLLFTEALLCLFQATMMPCFTFTEMQGSNGCLYLPSSFYPNILLKERLIHF